MSQNNPSIIYAGIDVAKATLQFQLHGDSNEIANDAKGHARIIKQLSAAELAGVKTHVILEATGGYEAALCAALHSAGKTLSVIQPARVRHFARAKNQHAKTDKIDAAVLVDFGQAMNPAPTPAPSAAQRHLTVLVGRRAQLVESRTVENNRSAHYTDSLLKKQSARMLKLLDAQVAECDKAISQQLAADAGMAARAVRVQQVYGIGPVIAAILQAHMPELGTLDDPQAAALAGLAPYNCDSGPHRGARRIRGGRAEVRSALYLAAMNAIRFDPILRAFYQRLLAAGKLRMVALTAVMRKLIVLLNRSLKNPDFKLHSPKSR